jgi:alkylation response protein AidB-like acyl-CoA dehydrogenase
MLATNSPPERVRIVETSVDRFDYELWTKMVTMGASSLAVSSALGGGGAGLVELALVAEEIGRVGAATPFIENAVIARMLLSLGKTASEPLCTALLEGRPIVSVALHEVHEATQLVPCGSAAEIVVALTDGALVVSHGTKLSAPANLACAPIAWWRIPADDSITLVEGPMASELHALMVREWKLLTAAAMVGLTETVLRDAVQYVKNRQAFGVSIGAFQAVSHPLVDIATGVEAARRLVWRAAWFADNEPAAAPELLPMAVLCANELAIRAVTIGVHVQGGFGVTFDSNMQLYYRRAKGWPLLAGDPKTDLSVIAGYIRPNGAANAREM